MKKLTIISSFLALVLAGCGASSPADEKEAYIEAAIESTCAILNQSSLPSNADSQEANLEIFKEKGLASTNEEVLALLDKYENDAEVKEAVTAGIEECSGANL